MIEAAPTIDPTKFGTARIVSRREAAEGLWVMRIASDFELGYRPGQYCTLALPVGGKLDAHGIARQRIGQDAARARLVLDDDDLPVFGGQRLALDGFRLEERPVGK